MQDANYNVLGLTGGRLVERSGASYAGPCMMENRMRHAVTASLVAALSATFAHAELRWQQMAVEVLAKPAEQSAVVDFAFTNEGSQAVTIQSVQTSCGCTTAALDKKTYAPGEAGKIPVTFNFGDRVGEQIKYITLRTDDRAIAEFAFENPGPQPVTIQSVHTGQSTRDQATGIRLMARKLASRSCPAVVKKLSGWNCTPSSGAGPKTPGLAQSHYLAFSRPGTEFEAGVVEGFRRDHQAVIARGFEGVGEPPEDSLAVVVDRGSFTVHQAIVAGDGHPENVANGLVAEADAEKRGFAREGANDLA